MRISRLKQMGFRWYVALLFIVIIVACPPAAGAECVVETPVSETEADVVMHLSSSCTPAERERHVVRGEAIMDAIAKGQRIDLVGVVIRGDLIFDRLTIQTALSSRQRSSEMQSLDGHTDGHEQRVVRAALRMKDSVMVGAIRHQSLKGMLVFEAPVDFQGSRFTDGVDLSRSVFQGSVELSGATFEKEAYFVQGQFSQQVNCRETKFGPSTRFHRSTFRGPIDCTSALFDGMAEFLEVNFEQPAVFERSRFGLGTGFSGSRFKGRVQFGEAIFSRETFFTFAVFESEAVFAGSQFLGPADFSQAEFRQEDDLAKARFDQPPLLAQAKRLMPEQADGLSQTLTGRYALTVVFLVAAAWLVAYAVRLK
jgi:uncharacterized protein YjbI with pentapeptide repeats